MIKYDKDGGIGGVTHEKQRLNQQIPVIHIIPSGNLT
jgi:hypothetical protein